jgi:hypothetical protein
VAASASAAPGQRVTDAKDGFSVVLPPGWAQVSLNSGDLGAILGSAGKDGLKLNSSLMSQIQSQAGTHIKFFAVSSALEDGGAFDPNMNVVVYPGTESLSLLSAQTKIGFASAGAKGVTTRRIHLARGPALLTTYWIPSTQGTAVYGTQVDSTHHGKTYIVSFSDETPSGSRRSESTMMSSWTYLSHH